MSLADGQVADAAHSLSTLLSQADLADSCLDERGSEWCPLGRRRGRQGTVGRECKREFTPVHRAVMRQEGAVEAASRARRQPTGVGGLLS